MRALAGLVVVAMITLSGAAWASPPGVTEKDGAFIAPDGKPLYTFANDRTAGKSACNNACATAWPPLASAAGAADDGDWTVITRDDGSKQWAYKGKPLYAFAKDSKAGDTTGDGFLQGAWHIAK